MHGVVDSRQISTVDYASPHHTRRSDCKENGFPFGRLLVMWLWWWSNGSWNLWNSNRQPKMSWWAVAKRGNAYSPVLFVREIKYPILFNSFNMRPNCTNIVFCSVGWFHPCFSGRDAGIDCLYSLGYCSGPSGAGGDGFMVPKFHRVVDWRDVRIADLMFW